MDDLVGPVKARAEAVLHELNRPGGLRSTIQSIRHKMAEADQRRAINRARAELQRLDSQANETVTAIGIQAVAMHAAGKLGSPELAPLCQHVLDIRAALTEQQDELARLEAVLAARKTDQAPPCPSCGKPLPAEGLYCAHCGAPVPGRTAGGYCARCGGPLRVGAKFCARCGQAVPG